MKRLLFAIALLVSCSACMRSSTLITLRADGSGTIDQETGINPQALAGLTAMAGDKEHGDEIGDVFNEKKAREEAEKMGVRFVSGAPIDTPALKGYHAKYAFDDIKALKVRMQNAAGPEARTDGRKPFDFDFAKGLTSSTITLNLPQDARKPTLPGLGGRGGDPEQSKQMMAMIRPMLAGLYVEIALAVDGRIVKTNAPYVTGNKITLVQLDMDQMLANEAAFAKLQEATDAASLKNIPGLKVTTEPTVTIEFRR